jgi:hypothetical protein
MFHKIKKLGISLVAVLALSLVVTSIAAAAQFTASNYPAFFEGNGNPSAYGSLSTEAGSIECTSGSASGTISEASSAITITNGAASGCKFGSFSATVSGNGCSSLVHVTGGSGDAYTGTSDILCPEGKTIVTVVAGGVCETQVHPQSGIAAVEFTNNTAEGSVGVKIKNTNFKFTVTKDGFGCPFNGTGEKTGSFSQFKTGIVKIAGKTVSVSG